MKNRITVKRLKSKFIPSKGTIEAVKPEDALMLIPVGREAEIKESEYRLPNVRAAVHRINKNGKYQFSCTINGCPDGCIVKRLN